jgi:hypothetical protein
MRLEGAEPRLTGVHRVGIVVAEGRLGASSRATAALSRRSRGCHHRPDHRPARRMRSGLYEIVLRLRRVPGTRVTSAPIRTPNRSNRGASALQRAGRRALAALAVAMDSRHRIMLSVVYDLAPRSGASSKRLRNSLLDVLTLGGASSPSVARCPDSSTPSRSPWSPCWRSATRSRRSPASASAGRGRCFSPVRSRGDDLPDLLRLLFDERLRDSLLVRL